MVGSLFGGIGGKTGSFFGKGTFAALVEHDAGGSPLDMN
jgi:hypothetical protein